MRLVILSLMILLGARSLAAADVERIYAGKLLEFCTSSDPKLDLACTHYILGFADGVSFGQDHQPKCIVRMPPVGSDVFKKAFVDYAKQVPELDRVPAAVVVLDAFSIAFPCY
jgi:hypothetical protein